MANFLGRLFRTKISCFVCVQSRYCSSTSINGQKVFNSSAEIEGPPNDQFEQPSFEDFSEPSSLKPRYWEDPWRYAKGVHKDEPPKYTNCVESKEEFHWVKRLLPPTQIPTPPEHKKYPTPSGWVAPRISPDFKLPYYVRRDRCHLFPLYLECRRDQLNPKTFEFDYVEIVAMKNIEGDVFACERDLRTFLEKIVGRRIGTHVNEAQRKIRVKGADRSLLEQFLIANGF